MIERVIEALDDGETPDVVDLRVKPALWTLLVDQAELIDSSVTGGPDKPDLRSGFASRREVIEWYQRAAVRTLGNIEDFWEPKDCVVDTVLVAALTEAKGDHRSVWYRRILEADVVQPACNLAYTSLRESATEYVKADDEDGEWAERELDPGRQRNVAMRPGFQTLDAQQHEVLTELWGGFGDTDDLLDWLHSLNSPTNGEIGGGFARATIVDDVALSHLVADCDSVADRRWREAFAATQVLPAFVAGVRTMEASELAKTTQDGSVTLRQQATHE